MAAPPAASVRQAKNALRAATPTGHRNGWETGAFAIETHQGEVWQAGGVALKPHALPSHYESLRKRSRRNW